MEVTSRNAATMSTKLLWSAEFHPASSARRTKGTVCQGQVRNHPCPPDVGGKIADAAIESGLSDYFLHVGTGKNLDMVEDGAISHAMRFADRGTLRV